MASLIFYKAKGNVYDKLIRFWTGSKFSHVELWIDGMSYTASSRDNAVRSYVKTSIDTNVWTVIPVNVDHSKILKFYSETVGDKYDWWGIILHELIPLRRHKRKAWYCSEWCAAALGQRLPQMSPQELYEIYN